MPLLDAPAAPPRLLIVAGEEQVTDPVGETGQPAAPWGRAHAEQARDQGTRACANDVGQHYRARLSPRPADNNGGYCSVTAGYGQGVVNTGDLASVGQSTNPLCSCMGWDGVWLGRRASAGPTAFPGQVVPVHRALRKLAWFSALISAPRAGAQR